MYPIASFFGALWLRPALQVGVLAVGE